MLVLQLLDAVFIKKLIPFLIIYVSLTPCSFGQSNKNRFCANYSIKEIDTLGVQKISLGEVFLDNNNKVLRFIQKFPTEQIYTLQDSILKIENKDSSYAVPSPKGLLDYNIYSIILTGKLYDFGINKTPYNLRDVREQDSLSIMTYTVKGQEDKAGKIEMIKKRGQLDAFLVYDIQGNIVSQSYFRGYVFVSGVQIPQKIIQISTHGEKQNKKITTLKEIKINETSRNDNYLP